MAEFIPKPLSYDDHLIKVQRIVKAAQYRNDVKIAIRELGEALAELVGALQEREQAQKSGANAQAQDKPSPPG